MRDGHDNENGNEEEDGSLHSEYLSKIYHNLQSGVLPQKGHPKMI